MMTPEQIRPFHPQQTVVLLAEDEVMVRNIVRIVLEGDGYLLLAAKDGQEALEIAHRYPGTIHLLLTDITMPGMDGLELYRRVREARPETAVIFMSGMPQTKLDGPFLSKPFQLKDLRQKVREAMPERDLAG